MTCWLRQYIILLPWFALRGGRTFIRCMRSCSERRIRWGCYRSILNTLLARTTKGSHSKSCFTEVLVRFSLSMALCLQLDREHPLPAHSPSNQLLHTTRYIHIYPSTSPALPQTLFYRTHAYVPKAFLPHLHVCSHPFPSKTFP